MWEAIQFSFGFAAVLFLSNMFILILNRDFHGNKDFSMMIWLAGIWLYKTIFRLFQKRLWLVIVSWILGGCIIIFVPLFDPINVWRVLMNSFIALTLIFILRRHMLGTIEYYVEWSKNNNMAFAGWMFLGALGVWFFRSVMAVR
jgi:hypothetical protein